MPWAPSPTVLARAGTYPALGTYSGRASIRLLMALTELQMGPDIEECIDNCFEASQAAEKCATHCIEMGETDRTRCIELCRDVAEMTSLHARMMARDSEYHSQLASVCADLCDTCADECERFDGAIPETCAEACRRCADSCRNMARA